MTSVLESEYIEPDRPYSQKELIKERDKLYKDLRIGNITANHTKCKHFYLVKKNGRKEKEIIENNENNDIGNCSVCWKLSKTHKRLKDDAYNLVYNYIQVFFKDPELLTYGNIDLEKTYYRWLYEDINK